MSTIIYKVSHQSNTSLLSQTTCKFRTLTIVVIGSLDVLQSPKYDSATCTTDKVQQKQPLLFYLVFLSLNLLMTETPIIKKPAHWLLYDRYLRHEWVQINKSYGSREIGRPISISLYKSHSVYKHLDINMRLLSRAHLCK